MWSRSNGVLFVGFLLACRALPCSWMFLRGMCRTVSAERSVPKACVTSGLPCSSMVAARPAWCGKGNQVQPTQIAKRLCSACTFRKGDAVVVHHVPFPDHPGVCTVRLATLSTKTPVEVSWCARETGLLNRFCKNICAINILAPVQVTLVQVTTCQ